MIRVVIPEMTLYIKTSFFITRQILAGTALRLFRPTTALRLFRPANADVRGCGVTTLIWGLPLLLLTQIRGAEGPRVLGYERFFASAESDAFRGGLLLLGELNCTSCHQADDSSGIVAKQAPRLDDVGSRVRPDHLRKFLMSPSQTDAGTTMPHMLHSSSDAERQRHVEALVHFLASTGQLSESAPVSAGVKRGERLFHSVGCVACHDSQRSEPKNGEANKKADAGQELATSVPIKSLSQKYSVPSLTRFLQNPLAIRPSGRMPHLLLRDEEARDIACYLMRDLQIPTSMTFYYYEGAWEKLPDFKRLPIQETGGASSFDVDLGPADHFAIRFQGKFRVQKDGQYRFFLSSDDGSRLVIDGREVISHDGIHAMDEKYANVPLAAGTHDFEVEYFEASGGQELKVEYQGQGVKKQSLEFALVGPQTTSRSPHFVPDESLVAEGRELFQTVGCAACHELHIEGNRLMPRRTGKKLTELVGGGCLELQPRKNVPFFGLTARQSEIMKHALATLRSKMQTVQSDGERIAQTLIAFNCYACHQRGGLGGVESSRNVHFQSNQQEMGEEGRLPPTLDGVGMKLRRDWLHHVFDKGAKDRPYMLTRMPRFGDAKLGNLSDALSRVDRIAEKQESSNSQLPNALPPDRKLKAIGRQLVGERGMSCVKCHTWANIQATGIQAISLTTMTRRLDRQWFLQYLLNPQTFRPGTRMPAAWPNGQSPFADILDGSAEHQIQAVWTYLSDGNEASMPAGIGSQPIELVPNSEPIIYRNFLDRVGPRGIGVGYPERVSLAFDADDCRLALIWQGAFIDASLHWVGRGAGFQRPLGDNVLNFEAGVSMATLKSLSDPWPKQPAREQGIFFKGYRLDDHHRPVFQYRWNEASVDDAIIPVVTQEGTGLRQAIRVLHAPRKDAWFRAITAKKIDSQGGGLFVIDDDWQMRVTSSSGKPITRTSQDRHELLIPITDSSTENQARIEIEYVW